MEAGLGWFFKKEEEAEAGKGNPNYEPGESEDINMAGRALAAFSRGDAVDVNREENMTCRFPALCHPPGAQGQTGTVLAACLEVERRQPSSILYFMYFYLFSWLVIWLFVDF